MDRIAIAQDQRGTVLYKIHPGFIGGAAFLLEGSGFDHQISVWFDDDDQVTDLDAETGLPIRWLRWLMLNIYGGSGPRSIHGETIFPREVTARSWADVADMVSAQDFEAPTEKLKVSLDDLARANLTRRIEDVLADLGIRLKATTHDSRSQVGSWVLMGLGASIEVYRQKQADDSVRLSYLLYRTGSAPGSIEAPDLVSLLKKTDLFVPAGDAEAWARAHMPPGIEWMVDIGALETYKLLGLPSPLAGPWDAAMAWFCEI